MNPALLPFLVIGIGVVFLLAAIKILIQQRKIIEMVPNTNLSVELPTKWNEAGIKLVLQRYQDQPAILSHVVSSIKTRFIMGQDLKTARRQLQFITGVIELFKLNKELQGLIYDLHIAEREFEIRQVETDIHLEDALSRQKSEHRLRQLRHERDELQLQKEMTGLRRDIREIEKPSASESKLTPEQQRAKDKLASEARIQKLKEEKQRALKIEDEDERIQRVNAIDSALQQEFERWGKLL